MDLISKLQNDDYTAFIPNTTEDFSEPFMELMKRWKKACEFIISDYGENQMRKSTWTPPEGYKFSRFINNGINLEVLQQEHEPSDNVILMIHGGSFIYRMNDQFVTFMPSYAKAGRGATVVSVDYRVPPHVNYQGMIDDIVKTYQWLLHIGYSPSNIIIAGDSSGGGTALATTLFIRDQGIELPAGIVTLSACTNLAANTQSHIDNFYADKVFGGHYALRARYKDFVGNDDYFNPYVSPYYGNYVGFPPMLMQVGSTEIILDDTLDIAEKAHRQGVDVTLEIYENMFHDFQAVDGLFEEANIAWANIQKFMDKAFSNNINQELEYSILQEQA